jgi:hypothetical protein
MVTEGASTRFTSADSEYLLQVKNSATCTPRTDGPKRHFHPNTSSVVLKLDLREGIFYPWLRWLLQIQQTEQVSSLC